MQRQKKLGLLQECLQAIIIKSVLFECYGKHPFLHRKRMIIGKLRIVTISV